MKLDRRMHLTNLLWFLLSFFNFMDFIKNLVLVCKIYTSHLTQELESSIIISLVPLVKIICESLELKCWVGVLSSQLKLTGNNCNRVSLLIKLQGVDCNFINKKTLVQLFSCELYKIFHTSFFIEHLWGVLL